MLPNINTCFKCPGGYTLSFLNFDKKLSKVKEKSTFAYMSTRSNGICNMAAPTKLRVLELYSGIGGMHYALRGKSSSVTSWRFIDYY